MGRKSWILSLSFPCLSILISTTFLILAILDELEIFYVAFLLIWGVICGGIMPLIIIIKFKVDTSEYFIYKLILCLALAAGIVVSWLVVLDTWLGEGVNMFVLPMLTFIAEILFVMTRKTSLKTKLCLVLSSPVYVYTGFVIDFCRGFANAD